MYTEYFGLKEPPFSIAPDPRYLYMSDKHREALAHLIYGIRGDGFILLTGEVGTGKTTICRCLLEQLPENTDVALVLYPRLAVRELLATICDELRISYSRGNANNKDLLDNINAYLLDSHARGRKTVVIIEEAQNLSTELLEQVRLLTNLETNSRKLLQIIMVGQPELRDILSRQDMQQVAQRITARYHLGPLSRDEVSAYVSHRLAFAGGKEGLFPASTVSKLFRLSGGVPRVINLLCDRALLGAYSEGKNAVAVSTVTRAWREISGAPDGGRSLPKSLRLVLAGIAAVICAAVVAGSYYAHVKASEVIAREVPVQKRDTQKKTLEWPEERPIEESADMSYRALFQQWGVRYEGTGEDACHGPGSPGFRCLHGLGGLDTLARLNRPAVLTLFDQSGRKYFVVLTALRRNEATFQVGSETRNVDVGRIAKMWFGDFVMLWKVPPGFHGDIKPGDRGLQVRWLVRRLAGIQGADAAEESTVVYNNEMVRRVKKFQLANGLTPDGIVGPRTVILLNGQLGSGGPKLNDDQGGK